MRASLTDEREEPVADQRRGRGGGGLDLGRRESAQRSISGDERGGPQQAVGERGFKISLVERQIAMEKSGAVLGEQGTEGHLNRR